LLLELALIEDGVGPGFDQDWRLRKTAGRAPDSSCTSSCKVISATAICRPALLRFSNQNKHSNVHAREYILLSEDQENMGMFCLSVLRVFL
jgi:hypothetical protein